MPETAIQIDTTPISVFTLEQTTVPRLEIDLAHHINQGWEGNSRPEIRRQFAGWCIDKTVEELDKLWAQIAEQASTQIAPCVGLLMIKEFAEGRQVGMISGGFPTGLVRAYTSGASSILGAESVRKLRPEGDARVRSLGGLELVMDEQSDKVLEVPRANEGIEDKKYTLGTLTAANMLHIAADSFGAQAGARHPIMVNPAHGIELPGSNNDTSVIVYQRTKPTALTLRQSGKLCPFDLRREKQCLEFMRMLYPEPGDSDLEGIVQAYLTSRT